MEFKKAVVTRIEISEDDIITASGCKIAASNASSECTSANSKAYSECGFNHALGL